nr:hypothetical protein CFP56_75028 [Quercus suber]
MIATRAGGGASGSTSNFNFEEFTISSQHFHISKDIQNMADVALFSRSSYDFVYLSDLCYSKKDGLA